MGRKLSCIQGRIEKGFHVAQTRRCSCLNGPRPTTQSSENGERTGTPDFQCTSRSSGRSKQRLWTHSQTTDSSSWAAHLVTERRSSCSSLLPKVSKPLRSGSRTILGRLCGCCARHRSSAGKSSWVREGSEQPHCHKARCASRGPLLLYYCQNSHRSMLPVALCHLMKCGKYLLPGNHER
jgi:hypothetical protein